MPPAKKTVPAKKKAPAKKIAAPKIAPIEPEITGPSSEPVAPVVTAGPVTAPVVRTALQGVTGGFMVQGLEVFNLASFTPDQRAWLVVVLTIVLSYVTNFVEGKVGRRLIGAV